MLGPKGFGVVFDSFKISEGDGARTPSGAVVTGVTYLQWNSGLCRERVNPVQALEFPPFLFAKHLRNGTLSSSEILKESRDASLSTEHEIDSCSLGRARHQE